MKAESYFEVEDIARVWILVGKPPGLLLALTSVQAAHYTRHLVIPRKCGRSVRQRQTQNQKDSELRMHDRVRVTDVWFYLKLNSSKGEKILFF